MNLENNVKLLVCAHKAGIFLNNEHYMPIQVGKALSTTDLNIQGDDTGENISRKNPYYCELTALFWAWKNLEKKDYIGLCHYRRYFDFTPWRCREKYVIQVEQLGKGQQLPDLKKMFKRYDIILPVPMVFRESLREHYDICHNVKDLDVLRKVIGELTPGYLEAFDAVMDQNNKLSGYNMFLTGWENFNNYCSWLFPVLFELEKRIDIPNDPYQARLFGFLGERLLNVFCYHHRLRVKYYPIVMIDEKKERRKCIFRYWWKRMRFNRSYQLKNRGKC